MLLQYHINIKSIRSKAQRRTLVLPSFIVHFCVFKKREMATNRPCCIPFSSFCCIPFSSFCSDDEEGQDHPASAGAPSSPSATDNTIEGATTSDTINTMLNEDIVEVDGKKVAVNIDKLMEHISDLLKHREKEMNPSSFPWPAVPGLNKLKDILSSGTDLKTLKELLSSGLEVASELKDIISGPITTILKEIGKASVATAGLLVVAYTLERFHDVSTNKEKCWDLIKEMSYVATVVKRLKQSPKGTQENVIEEATALVVEGAIICCTQIGRSAWKSFFTASKDKDDLSDMRQKLNVKYMQINIEIGFRVLTAIECQGRSPLSKKYPTHAVGIDEPVKEVLRLLEIESDKNAVTVILHGFGGMGKTTLADAVFSYVGGCKYSKVRLFKDINSTPVIEELQKQILKDLMEPGETIPEIRTYEDGRRELKEVLQTVQAFIYIDNVLGVAELRKLLPSNMNAAKKVRILLTARNKNVKNACPLPQIYEMKGIKDEEAKIILQNEIKEGINDIEFEDIIQICGGIPLMLTLTAPFIGGAPNKQEAYNALKEQKDKWTGEDFQDMHCAFAYDALPHDCKDPFLDICSYFKGWDWHIVEDIVGKNEVKMLESRALVTRTTNGVASVHDVILTLAQQKSKEESKGKQVRLSFTSARELMAYLEEKKEGSAEGIKGIWLTDNKDMLQISALTLDLMHNSLRVLQLGKLTEVEGKCSKKFEELVFFEAKVPQLPFHDVSKLKQLRYLSYAPNELKLSKDENEKENMKNNVLSELDGLITNGRGERDHLSHLLRKTSTLLIFDKYNQTDMDQFPWPLIEETVDDRMQIKIIYIGPHFDQLPTKVKDTIFNVQLSNDRTQDILTKVAMAIDYDKVHLSKDILTKVAMGIDYDVNEHSYVQMDTKTVGDGNSDNHGPSSCWRYLAKDELEEFVVCNSGRYLQLKQLAETNKESNLELLIELFAPDGNETTPVFQKNESSQQDRMENFERKTTTCGVDKLKGKTIIVEMWPYNSWRWAIYNHQFWKEVYFMGKKKVDLEIISIPIVYPSKECDVIDVYKQFSREVPWLVLQNSWTVITRAVKFFFEKDCRWKERTDECAEKWYPTINWIIEPKGRISVYRPSIFQQPKNMSTLEFLFNHLESVSPQVRELMRPGKLICLYRAGDHYDQIIYSIWNALDQQQRDRIHVIHLGRREMKISEFTNHIKRDYYYPLKNTDEIEGMSSLNLLNLSENEIVRFSLRLCHLQEEINRMEDSELKFLLHFFQDEDDCMYGSIAFMDGDGKVVAALRGKILKSIFGRREISQRFIKSIMNDIEGPGVFESLIQNLQTSLAAPVKQQTVDDYFKSLRKYTSELWGLRLYHPFRFNKEGRKRSLPRFPWPTSEGLCRLKNFLSEGINDNWVKDVISRHPEEKDKLTIVVHSLLKVIEEAFWAVAGLLAVADILERFETISANRMHCLFRLHEMFKVAQRIQQFNQKPGLWRRVRRVATAIILTCSINCCCQIDESKFAVFVRFRGRLGKNTLKWAQYRLNMMARAEGFYGRDFFLKSGDEGGPSCEGESGVEGGSTAGTSGQEE